MTPTRGKPISDWRSYFSLRKKWNRFGHFKELVILAEYFSFFCLFLGGGEGGNIKIKKYSWRKYKRALFHIYNSLRNALIFYVYYVPWSRISERPDLIFKNPNLSRTNTFIKYKMCSKVTAMLHF